MKKVYVLIQYFIDDTDVVGVFSTFAIADKAKCDVQQIREAKYFTYEIQELEMQKLCMTVH